MDGPLAGSVISCIAVNGNNIFAGGEGVFISNNKGMTWTRVIPSTHNVFSLDVKGSKVVVGADYSEAFYSNDSGLNWKDIGIGRPSYSRVRAIAFCGTNIIACMKGEPCKRNIFV